MTILMFVFAAALSAGPSIAIQEREVQPLEVHVTGKSDVEPPDKEQRKTLQSELRNEVRRAEKRRKDLERELQKQHGKKSRDWPEDAQIRYETAREAEAAARFELDYLACTQNEVDASVQDLREAFDGKGTARKKKFVAIVDKPEEADLIVEVLARREKLGVPNVFFVVVKITPSDRADPWRMSTIEPAGRWFRHVQGLHGYKPGEPHWMIEIKVERPGGVAGLIGAWSMVANEVAATIDEFIEKNHEALTAH